MPSSLRPAGVGAAIGRPLRALHPRQRRRDCGIDTDDVVRIAAGFDESAHGVRGFGLAQQDAMYAAAEDLAKLPGIITHMRRVDAVDRRLDDDGRRAVTRPRRPGLDHAVHVGGKARHVEAAVLHADIHVIGPGGGIDAALRRGQHMAAVRPVVIDRLILLQQLDTAIDPRSHGFFRFHRRLNKATIEPQTIEGGQHEARTAGQERQSPL